MTGNNVITVGFKTSDLSIRNFYDALEKALEDFPDDMPVAAIIGTLEVFKANIISSLQTLED